MIGDQPDDEDEDDFDEEDVFGLDEKAFQADLLFTQRINSWVARGKGEAKPYVFAHWTKHGTLRMEPAYLAGMLQCQLMLDDRVIATFTNPYYCFDDIVNGRLDRELGFSPTAVGVPTDLRAWGTFKT